MSPWFDEQTAGMIGGIIGSSMGIAGGIIGGMSGLCVRKGWKKPLYGAFSLSIFISLGLLITGLVALLAGQPRHVWYVFGLPGLIGTVIFATLLPAIRKRFIDNELLQMHAKDIL